MVKSGAKNSPNKVGSTEEPKVRVVLNHYHSKSQCISEWQKKELKNFTATLNTIHDLTESEFRNHSGLNFKRHKGPASKGFTRPQNLSKDTEISEIKVSGKARLHGVLLRGEFHIVWFDRNHEVFPSK